MASKFRLEVEVVVEDDAATKTLEVARKHYVPAKQTRREFWLESEKRV
jgi:hypothetical protein